jgi:GH24 family phage-related lysozyme (muramidase)
MNGPDYTKLCEGYTAVATMDSNGLYEYGYGHNGPDVKPGAVCSPELRDELFAKDYPLAEAKAAADVGPEWNGLDAVRKAALTDMAYELGGGGLAGFHRMLMAVRVGNWPVAAAECLDSAGYGKSVSAGVRARANRAALMLSTGAWRPGYGG